MTTAYETVTKRDERGDYMVLPSWCGFSADEEVELELVGDTLYVRRRDQTLAAPQSD